MSCKQIALTTHNTSIQTLIRGFLSLLHNNMCKPFSIPTSRLFLSMIYIGDKIYVKVHRKVATLQLIINSSAKYLLKYIQ
jgi:hypothetical protein